MRTSLAGRPGPAGLACRLALALALAACGESGGEGESGADTASAARASAASATAADTCGAPPPAYSNAVLTGSWPELVKALADSVSFPDIQGNDDTTSVKLCHTCNPVRVEIRASNRTPCLRKSDLSGQGSRITGMLIVLDTFPAHGGWDTIPAGDTIFTFAHSPAGRATLVYDRGGNGKKAPEHAWNFWFCADGANNGKTPQAQWRPRGTPPGNPGKGKDNDAGEDEGGSYGWMACASGCCQFYTPPPNENMQATPSQANENAPDTVGAGASKAPYWCPTG